MQRIMKAGDTRMSNKKTIEINPKEFYHGGAYKEGRSRQE